MQIELPSWPNVQDAASRVETLRGNMAEMGIDALAITSYRNFEYYSGFQTLFWVSDTRPQLAVVRRDRLGITLVLSSVERRAFRELNAEGLDAVFYDGFTEVAMEALGSVLAELRAGSKIGFDYGADMMGRGSIALFNRLVAEPGRFALVDAGDLIWKQRLIKSAHELDAKRAACKIATDAFFSTLNDLALGMSEWEVGQRMKCKMIENGAETVDWLPLRIGQGACAYTVLNGARELAKDDFIWADMGARRADQISDLSRIAKVGPASAEQQDLYDFVRGTTLRIAEGVRPGMTGHDVFMLFQELWSKRGLPNVAIAGRIGHGSGLSLTEPPSLMAGSKEVILEDMVLHVEPKLEAAGGMFQTEEVFRVTPAGPEFLSDLAPAALPVIAL